MKRIRDYGFKFGVLPTGPKNGITDVQGVKVGHTTIQKGDVNTGVTAILPHGGNIFQDKVIAATHVINGFGKSLGTIQVNELGTIETPIVLTNTLSVGVAADAVIEYMLTQNPDIGVNTGTVNPIICECNDMFLNDIRGKHVRHEHIFQALEDCSDHVIEGAIGAGTGMSCYQMKGGVGTSSRLMTIEDETYTTGVHVLTNFGLQRDLVIDGLPVGEVLQSEKNDDDENGSIIIIVATDAPLSHRQLQRVIKRAIVGLNRTGSFIGGQSGEVVIGFTTANTVPHVSEGAVRTTTVMHESHLDVLFRGVAEACEEAIVNSMIKAVSTTGRAGNTLDSLNNSIAQIVEMKSQVYKR